MRGETGLADERALDVPGDEVPDAADRLRAAAFGAHAERLALGGVDLAAWHRRRGRLTVEELFAFFHGAHRKQTVTLPGGNLKSEWNLAFSMRIGVLGLQGAFTEHVDAVREAFEKAGIDGSVASVRRREELEALDGLIMPGGESTTISKLLRAFDLHDLLVRRASEEDFPILGTCAGMILLSKEGDGQVEKTDTRLLGLMDMAVNRNAFGRQRESFEAQLDIKGFDAPVPGVFIRAPAITRTWGRCEALGTLGDFTIAAKQGNRLAIAFHPELTRDTRVHERFVNLVADWR